MKIATKLYGSFALMLVLIAVLGLYASYQIKSTLLQSQGENSIIKSREIINRLDRAVYDKIMEVGAATRRSWIINIVNASNNKYELRNKIDERVTALDSPRHGLKPVDPQFTPAQLETNELSEELRAEFIHFYEYQQGYRTLSYILVTNRYGAVIARTDPLAGFFYERDGWWREARRSGVYIGEVEQDESTGSYGIPAAFSIVDKNGDFAGVLKTVIDIKAIIHSLDLGININDSSRVTLLTGNGLVIYRTLPYRFMEDFSNWRNFSRLQGKDGYFVDRSSNGRKRFYSYARSEGYKLYPGAGWIFVSGLDQDEILATAMVLRNRIALSSLVLLLFFSLLAFWLSRSIIGSLWRFNQGVKRFGRGDLNYRLKLKSGDELGQLAGAFNNMAANLQQITASRDELNREIEKRHKAQEKIRQLNLELEQRIIERTAQLEASNRELEAFAYSVSHDLRAPLRAVGGYSQMLLEDHADSLDKEGQRKLNVVRDSAEEMGRLIDGLLSFSRLGRSAMKLGPINMENMVKEIFAGQQRYEKTDQARLHMKPLPPALGDATMLRSVFTNLLSNSIKFTKPGEYPDIEVGSREEPHETVYYVRDHGVGFDMKYADKLFKVFQRLHSAKDFQGTGIGLALVQRIINRHGGRMWAESEVDKGTTMYFTLPKQTPDREPPLS